MDKRVLIVGDGVIGLCLTYYCARRRHHVTVIERGPSDHDGCSLGNVGLVVPSHVIPLSVPEMVALGHRQITTTEVYARVSDGSLRRAVAMI